MSRPPVLALVLLVAVLGCGGRYQAASGTSSHDADALVGTWEGTYSAQGTQGVVRHGTMRIVIRRTSPTNAFVGVEGTAVDVTQGNATVGGTFYDSESSQSSLAFTYASGPGDGYVGRPDEAAIGRLVGPIFLNLTDIHVPTDLDLAPVTP